MSSFKSSNSYISDRHFNHWHIPALVITPNAAVSTNISLPLVNLINSVPSS
ncbi:hypothetical protein [Nostoc sp. UHCC 0252]|uniref:hypothetical protein n=1 Tax=Nostoc sp. UHCC 0252 TaxID=3110241 RepID=UPI002B215CAD|nr:hypothetical protein [Nostoc sp. UHCC 0252]MEA5605521.1 hypothetical protein [Nostoc sp. UHCC 0252]